jgi:BMFP domain-containing protein YqiC
MQIDKKLLDDMAKVAGSAREVMVDLTREAETTLKKNLERVMRRMDFVPREEFEVVREMAARARASQSALEKRIAALEKRGGAKPAAKPAAKKKAPARAKRKKS